MTVRWSACSLALLLASCGEARQIDSSDNDVAPDTAIVSQTEPARPGIRFDPAALQPGERVGELVADSISARRTIVDSTHVGVAWFTGQIELTGWTMLHPDADLRDVAVCFEADEASAARMPRWENDERRPWFCFTNRDDAQRMLGPPSDRVPATIVIEQFTIHRGLTDEVNSARLVSATTHLPG
jgi:hypothetical protein